MKYSQNPSFITRRPCDASPNAGCSSVWMYSWTRISHSCQRRARSAGGGPPAFGGFMFPRTCGLIATLPGSSVIAKPRTSYSLRFLRLFPLATKASTTSVLRNDFSAAERLRWKWWALLALSAAGSVSEIQPATSSGFGV